MPQRTRLLVAVAWTVARTRAIWPAPVFVSPTIPGEKRTQLNPQLFEFKYADRVDSLPSVLDKAFSRYRKLFFPHSVDTGDEGEVAISIKNVSAPLEYGTDESYALRVSSGFAEIVSATSWGALRGLETLSQLIEFDGSSYYLSDRVVFDKPRFSHRGLLVDSGRHFEPIPALERLVESMTFAKLNVLHWHLTEDQSFPMPSETYPELPEKGAWSKSERYTRADVEDFVEFCRLRGVRVIPEFDMPGHTSSWRNAHPEIFSSGCSEDERGAFDPAKNETWELLTKQLDEWAEDFSDDFVHLGTDEVPSKCWNNTFDLEWMAANNLTDFGQTYGYFVDRAVSIARRRKSNVVLWDEAFSSTAPPKDKESVVIQNWHSDDLLREIVVAGYRALASSATYWYLDHLATSWETMYNFEPFTNIPFSSRHLVIGGEGCMWGETVDPSDLEATVWPRAAAIAERLWSPQSHTFVPHVTAQRLSNFRCLLLSRGVRSGLVNATGRAPPSGPGSCSQ